MEAVNTYGQASAVLPLLLDSHMEVSTIKQNVFRTGITEIQIIIITDIAKLGLNHICRLSGSIFSWKLTGLATTAHYFAIFIRPESDHWLCLSVTHSLTDCCLVNLIDVTLRCEDANSKLVEVVTVADVDAEDHVGNSLLIWELTFGHKAQLLFRLWAQGLVKI